MWRFEYDYEIIKCVAKGKQWTLGEKPVASVYRWLLKPVGKFSTRLLG